MRATPWFRWTLALLLAAGPTARLSAQGTIAIPAGSYRGTVSFGDRIIPVQVRSSGAGEPSIQLAVSFEDTTPRRMWRGPGGDSLLAVLPGGDTLRLAPRVEGESLRGAARLGTRTGTIALRRVVSPPLEAIKPRAGEYRLDDGTLFSVWGADNAFDGLYFMDFETGRTGTLFSVDSTRFVAGPRRIDSDPESYTVQFEPGDRIAISNAEGRRVRGRRAVLSRAMDVTFPTTGDVRLAGTLHLPTTPGPHPATITLHGSDWHLRGGGPILTFFLSRGIAVLTWDKRGNGGSGGTLQTVTIDTMAVDAQAAIRWLRARPEIDPKRIGVWGISQGGWPASILAARDSSLAFVILHAGSSLTPAAQGDDEMRVRVLQDGGTEGGVDTLLAYYHHFNDVMRGRATRASLDSMYAALGGRKNRFLWPPSVAESPRARWVAGINDFDPVPYWSKARVPVLAFFGEHDGLVAPETNVPVLREALARSGNRDATIVVLPRANHLFQETSKRRTSIWLTGSRDLPEYYETMAKWLERRLGTPSIKPVP